jgi:hypothetical protein
MLTVLRSAVALGLLVHPLCVSAEVIGFDPSQTEQAVGSKVVLDIVAADLTLGAFDLTVSFDPMLLSPSAIEFDTFLGFPFSIQDSSMGFSSLNVTETSLLSPGELILLQQGGFRLARLSFDAMMSGVTEVSFTSATVADADGVLFSPNLGSATVTIRAQSDPAVPEPPSGLLFVAVLLAMGIRAKWHPRR